MLALEIGREKNLCLHDWIFLFGLCVSPKPRLPKREAAPRDCHRGLNHVTSRLFPPQLTRPQVVLLSERACIDIAEGISRTDGSVARARLRYIYVT